METERERLAAGLKAAATWVEEATEESGAKENTLTIMRRAADLLDRLEGERRRFESWEECREAYLHDPVLYNFVHTLIAESHNSLVRTHQTPEEGEGDA